MPRHGLERDREIIHLLSDSGEDGNSDNEVERCNAQPVPEDFPDDPESDDLFEGLPEMPPAEDRDIVHLGAIPDLDPLPSEHHSLDNRNPVQEDDAGDVQNLGRLCTKQESVQIVLDVLPDISVEHVLKVIDDNTTDATRTLLQCERLIEQIMDSGEYPKQTDETRNKKRKRDAEESLSDYENDERDPDILGYEADA